MKIMQKLVLISFVGVQSVWWPQVAVAVAGPPCKPGQNYGALDISEQVNDKFLKNVKSIGISTIMRYYDWEQETLPGKTLTVAELALIKRNALNVAVVFQHNNNRTATFETSGRGRTDAKRSLYLARTFDQPSGSAIYFGVDGVDALFEDRGRATDKFGLNLITRYFKEIKNEFGANKNNVGYPIGVYGSGLVCREILNRGLAKYCWLAGATSWPEYDGFKQSDRWSLLQSVETECFGKKVELNRVNPRFRNFGQWKP